MKQSRFREAALFQMEKIEEKRCVQRYYLFTNYSIGETRNIFNVKNQQGFGIPVQRTRQIKTGIEHEKEYF